MNLTLFEKIKLWIKEQNPFEERALFMVQVNSPICSIVTRIRAVDSLTAFQKAVKEGMNRSGFITPQSHEDMINIVMSNPSLFKVTRLQKPELCFIMKAIKYGHERLRFFNERITNT